MSEALNMFLEGNLIVDCSENQAEFTRMMRVLESETSIMWMGNCRPTYLSFKSDEPFIWAFRRKDWDPRSAIHVMTHGSDVEEMKNANPKAIVRYVTEFLEEIVTPEKPLDAIENDLLLEVLMS